MKEVLKDGLYIFGFALLTAIGASIKLPFFPYHPFTMQLIFVLLSGALLGSFRGPLSQVVFLALGLFGLPLFNQLAPGFPVPALGASPAFTRIVLKSGWLLGFVAASYVTAVAFEYAKKMDFWTIITAISGGFLTLYILGISFPVLIFGFPITSTFIGWAWPFFAMDLLEMGLVVLFLVNLNRLRRMAPASI